MHGSGVKPMLALAAVWIATSAQAELKYRIQDLGILQGGDEFLAAAALNNSGTVVGYSDRQDVGVGSRIGAFIYENGRMHGLAPFGVWGNYYEVTDINDAGIAVGSHTVRKARTRVPVMYRDGQIIDLSVVPGGGQDGFAAAVNKDGMAVGYLDRRAFIYDGTSSRYIPVGHPTQIVEAKNINDHGLVLGTTYGGNAYNFLWDGNTTTRLPALSDVESFEAVDLNNGGTVLGLVNHFVAGGLTQRTVAVYADGNYRLLEGTTADAHSYFDPYAINEQGWIVGAQVGSDNPDAHAVLWRDGQAVNLNDLVVGSASGAGWYLQDARDINERGQIVGHAVFNGLGHAYLATPVPEGNTWAQLLAGLGVVGWWLRRGAAPGATGRRATA